VQIIDTVKRDFFPIRALILEVRAADVGNAVRLMIAGEDQIST